MWPGSHSAAHLYFPQAGHFVERQAWARFGLADPVAPSHPRLTGASTTTMTVVKLPLLGGTSTSILAQKVRAMDVRSPGDSFHHAGRPRKSRISRRARRENHIDHAGHRIDRAGHTLERVLTADIPSGRRTRRVCEEHRRASGCLRLFVAERGQMEAGGRDLAR
ncbi:uncharacterized protein SCHCODRAFT_02314845 [Schizophyllum commune H4-8]|uniref:uncharacterized protein n=1 Tax=Schizophyllum commune (strain H4-8 / FGSC 9210) TaxID=578458 RepID=UPI0021601499|nr:uncharacterized protein SCHCODRAFT_02314845 [Schizophyllum commune H4-8]KAI5891289.1 hypothetical protein SCHCODRAFT_02314845 [Schizophyllum commune H4-8]